MEFARCDACLALSVIWATFTVAGGQLPLRTRDLHRQLRIILSRDAGNLEDMPADVANGVGILSFEPRRQQPEVQGVPAIVKGHSENDIRNEVQRVEHLLDPGSLLGKAKGSEEGGHLFDPRQRYWKVAD